jgi:O-methyltransferase
MSTGRERDGVTSATDSVIADRYLNLLAGCLTRSLFLDEEVHEVSARGWRHLVMAPLQRLLSQVGLRLVSDRPTDMWVRAFGEDWPRSAETMVGNVRLNNLRTCIESILDDHVPGDLLEAGAWRGGAAIFMRGVLAAYKVTERTVWVADSFRGLPPPDISAYPADVDHDLTARPELAVSLEEVRANFLRYELLDERVQFLAGWFRDTLPGAPVDRLAVLRVDGDLYGSTTEALSALYPKLSVGGYVIVDDYGAIEPCRKAVHNFRTAHSITEAIVRVDWTGIYWRKER